MKWRRSLRDTPSGLERYSTGSPSERNFTPWYLLGGFVFSVIGIYYYRQGRQRHYRKTLWAGVALLAYPLFVSNTILVWCVGFFLWSVAYYFKADGQ